MRVLTYGLNAALTHGANCEVLIYKHECNHLWVEMRHWSLNTCKRILCDSNQV